MTSADIAVVTGANQGIGREVARLLAAEGMVVYLGARDDGRGRAAACELSSGFLVNAVDPGFTATALNGHTGTSTATQSAETVVQLALSVSGPSGRLFDSTGEIGW